METLQFLLLALTIIILSFASTRGQRWVNSYSLRGFESCTKHIMETELTRMTFEFAGDVVYYNNLEASMDNADPQRWTIFRGRNMTKVYYELHQPEHLMLERSCSVLLFTTGPHFKEFLSLNVLGNQRRQLSYIVLVKRPPTFWQMLEQVQLYVWISYIAFDTYGIPYLGAYHKGKFCPLCGKLWIAIRSELSWLVYEDTKRFWNCRSKTIGLVFAHNSIDLQHDYSNCPARP